MSGPAEEAKETPRVWRETFLARYPRKLKLAVTALLLLGLAVPFIGGGAPGTETPKVASAVAPAATVVESVAPESVTSEPGARERREREPDVKADAVPQVESTRAEPSVASHEAEDHQPLADAPDSGLVERTADGLLPLIGADGRQPWQVYARPFDGADRRPRIAFVVEGLGLSRVATDAAIRQLPSAVTLVFDPHSAALAAWLARARQDGHETLLSVPIEPNDYPRSDPGANTLLSYLPVDKNRDRILWTLKQGAGYIGLYASNDLHFEDEPDQIGGVLKEIKNRGLILMNGSPSRQNAFMDMAKAMHVPASGVSMRVDATPAPDAIDSAFSYLEQTARVSGYAVGLMSPLPLTIERFQAWAQSLPAKGIALAPVSALVQ